MENKELYEISNFRVFTSIMAIIFLLIIVKGVIPDYLNSPISNAFWIFAIIVFVGLFFISSYFFFRIRDLPDELNNLLALFIIGSVIEVSLYLIFPLGGLIFGSLYMFYFISKIDENNKILYNRYND